MSSSNGIVTLDAKSITAETYAVDKEQIANKVKEYKGLSITGIDDKDGFNKVRAGRLELRSVRCDIERRRKELKEGALAFGKAVDSVAKELTLLVEPTEKELAAKEEAIEKEIAAIARKKLDDRMAALNAVNAGSSPSYVEALNDKMFEELLADKKAAFERSITEKKAAEEEAERVRQAEAAQKKLEQEKLEAERVALEEAREALRVQQQEAERQAAAQRAEMARQQAEAEERAAEQRRAIAKEQAEAEKLAAEQRSAIAKEQAEAERVAAAQRDELARQQREIEAEREKIEADKREALRLAEEEAERVAAAERMKQEALDREARAAEEAAIAEAVKPDGEKLAAFASKLSKMKLPAMTSEHSQAAWVDAQSSIDWAVQRLTDIAESLSNRAAF